jgi:hypothetical protein
MEVFGARLEIESAYTVRISLLCISQNPLAFELLLACPMSYNSHITSLLAIHFSLCELSNYC